MEWGGLLAAMTLPEDCATGISGGSWAAAFGADAEGGCLNTPFSNIAAAVPGWTYPAGSTGASVTADICVASCAALGFFSLPACAPPPKI